MKAQETTTTPTSGETLLMTRSEYAKRTRFSLRKLDLLVNDGVIPAIKFSAKCTRIPVAQADAALLSLVEGGRAQ